MRLRLLIQLRLLGPLSNNSASQSGFGFRSFQAPPSGCNVYIHSQVYLYLYASYIYTHKQTCRCTTTNLPIYMSVYRSVYLSMQLSTYLSIHVSVYPSIHPSIHPSPYSINNISIYLSSDACINLSVHAPLYLPSCSSIELFSYPRMYPVKFYVYMFLVRMHSELIPVQIQIPI